MSYSRGNILWVDDEIEHLKPHILFLEEKGYSNFNLVMGNSNEAVDKTDCIFDIVLIDGNHVPKNITCPGKAVVKGDGISLSIAAASVVAKVTRDQIMATLALRYPVYGWEKNAGYGTKQHQRGLSNHGISPHHRRSFAPISRFLGPRTDEPQN